MHRSNSFVFNFVRLTRFGVFIPTSIVALAVITLGIGGTHRAKADITVNTPAGLVPGDTFRIAFLTDSGMSATSTNIADYNAFVNADAKTEAGGGSVTYNGTPLTFSAIVSTEAVSAQANIGQTGAPVFSMRGEVAASDTASSTGGLWSYPHPLLNGIYTDLTGNALPTYVWTGTSPNGFTNTPEAMGDQSVVFGVAGYTNIAWVTAGALSNDFGPLPLYGISQTLTVVPEPASILLCLSAGGCGAVGAYARRRMAGRRGR